MEIRNRAFSRASNKNLNVTNALLLLRPELDEYIHDRVMVLLSGRIQIFVHSHLRNSVQSRYPDCIITSFIFMVSLLAPLAFLFTSVINRQIQAYLYIREANISNRSLDHDTDKLRKK